MIPYEKAKKMAQEYLHNKTSPHSNYKWKFVDGKKTSEGWVFDYACECINKVDQKETVALSGAPAFIVLFDNCSIRDLSWQEYNNLKPSAL